MSFLWCGLSTGGPQVTNDHLFSIFIVYALHHHVLAYNAKDLLYSKLKRDTNAKRPVLFQLTVDVDVSITLQVLLPAANILQLTYVRDACCEFLQSQLHPTNCLGIRAFADLHGCLELLNIADTYVETHFA